jgi:hypothetical protein
MAMLALYLEDAGNNRFKLLSLLQEECQISFDGMKRILAGDRLKLSTGEFWQLKDLQEKLEELGACAVIRAYYEGIDD